MSDAQLIRTIMARECDTVNEYEQMAAKAESEAIRSLILHLAEEEKEHIAECSQVLARLDAEYARYLAKPLGHIDEALETAQQPAAPTTPGPTTPAAAPGTGPTAAPAAPVPAAHPTSLPSGTRLSSAPNQLTVGSLFRSHGPKRSNR